MHAAILARFGARAVQASVHGGAYRNVRFCSPERLALQLFQRSRSSKLRREQERKDRLASLAPALQLF